MNFDALSPDEKESQLVNFLLSKSDELDEFVDEAGAQGYNLDYSLTSLSELERYVLDKQVSFQDTSDEALLRRTKCWQYLGEVVAENYAGRWILSDNAENTANRGLFVLVGHSSVAGLEYVPMRQLQAFTLRRQPGMFYKGILNHVSIPKSVLDDTPTED